MLYNYDKVPKRPNEIRLMSRQNDREMQPACSEITASFPCVAARAAGGRTFGGCPSVPTNGLPLGGGLRFRAVGKWPQRDCDTVWPASVHNSGD